MGWCTRCISLLFLIVQNRRTHGIGRGPQGTILSAVTNREKSAIHITLAIPGFRSAEARLSFGALSRHRPFPIQTLALNRYPPQTPGFVRKFDYPTANKEYPTEEGHENDEAPKDLNTQGNPKP